MGIPRLALPDFTVVSSMVPVGPILSGWFLATMGIAAVTGIVRKG